MATNPAPPRRPALAALLGLLQPGLGHVYAGRFRRGVAMITILLVASAANTLFAMNDIAGWWLLPIVPITILLYIGQAIDAFRAARGAPVPYTLKSYNTLYTYALVLVFGLGLGKARDSIKEGFVEAYRVPSTAMAETIQLGDWLYVDKREAARIAPTRNALIVYRSPDDRTLALKRVVGVAGDTLRMRNDTLYRNDEPVREPYAHVLTNAEVNLADTPLERMRTWGPVIVGRGTVFVLGDNRHASKDSRHVGLIPLDSVVGTPSVVYYSYDPEGDWPLPALTAIRWQRLGMRLR